MTTNPIHISLNKYRTDQQARFVGTSSHFAAFIGGIGSGKSYGGCIRGLLASFGYIGTKQRIPTPNLGVIVAPSYTMLRDATLRTFFEVAGESVTTYNKVEFRAQMANGSEILFRSTDNPESLRGPNIAWAMMDEAALSSVSAWDILLGRLRQFGQLGYLWLTTTPKGRNWIWQKFVQEANPARRLFKGASRDNLALSSEVLEAWENAYTGDFARQELEGEFVAFEGLVYPEFDRQTHVSTARPSVFVNVVAGVDWGWTNPGVITVFGVDGDGRMWGLHEEYRRQRRIEEWANVATELRNTYGIKTFFCDPSEPNYIKALQERGCKTEAANNEVNTGIQKVKARLVKRSDHQPRLILSPSFVYTFTEFEQYQWRPQADKQGFRDEPVKANDHTLDSIRYAVMGVDHPRVKKLDVEIGRYA
jgi:PBSX family phage terminase large subunit